MKKYISMGYERTEVAIGLAYVQQAKLSDSEVGRGPAWLTT